MNIFAVHRATTTMIAIYSDWLVGGGLVAGGRGRVNVFQVWETNTFEARTHA